jgi:shikimate 5-dehydrogenase
VVIVPGIVGHVSRDGLAVEECGNHCLAEGAGEVARAVAESVLAEAVSRAVVRALVCGRTVRQRSTSAADQPKKKKRVVFQVTIWINDTKK